MLARVNRVVAVVACVPLLLSSLPAQEAQAAARPGGLTWGPCAAPGESGGALGSVLKRIGMPRRQRQEPVGSEVECATVRVPLDYAEPYGQQISLAINRIKGTVSPDAGHLGVLLVNPGGPGASGLGLAKYVASS